MVYTLFFFSSKCSLFHKCNVFGSCTIHILYTGVLKLKKNYSDTERFSNELEYDIDCTMFRSVRLHGLDGKCSTRHGYNLSSSPPLRRGLWYHLTSNATGSLPSRLISPIRLHLQLLFPPPVFIMACLGGRAV